MSLVPGQISHVPEGARRYSRRGCVFMFSRGFEWGSRDLDCSTGNSVDLQGQEPLHELLTL